MSSIHAAHPECVSWRIVDDEAVLIHAETSDYFSLNASGTFLWCLLVEAPRGVEELAEELAGRYGRDPEVAREEVKALVDALTEAKLVSGEAPAAAPTGSPVEVPEAGAASAYEAPALVRFGDLETLILSAE